MKGRIHKRAGAKCADVSRHDGEIVTLFMCLYVSTLNLTPVTEANLSYILDQGPKCAMLLEAIALSANYEVLLCTVAKKII